MEARKEGIVLEDFFFMYISLLLITINNTNAFLIVQCW